MERDAIFFMIKMALLCACVHACGSFVLVARAALFCICDLRSCNIIHVRCILDRCIHFPIISSDHCCQGLFWYTMHPSSLQHDWRMSVSSSVNSVKVDMIYAHCQLCALSTLPGRSIGVSSVDCSATTPWALNLRRLWRSLKD